MQTIHSGYRSLSLLVTLNFDRVVIPLAIIVGLVGGALIGAELAQMQFPPAQTQF